MKTAFYTFLITCLLGVNVSAQNSLNDYKYVIVPEKYEFLKEPNQYQLNALSKFLFEKYGFEAYMEGEEFPDDLNSNPCLALNASMIEDSSLFKTILTLILKNCKGAEIYKGPEGLSREKSFERAYTEATRNAFKPLELLNYKFELGNIAASKAVLPEQQIEPEKVKKLPPAAKAANIKAEPKAMEGKKNMKPQDSRQHSVDSSEILYAQEITNGFQLIDKTPKVVYRMFHTQKENVFLVENHSAIIYKDNGQWIYESVEKGVVVQKNLLVKF